MIGWMIVRNKNGELIADWDDKIYGDEFVAQQQLRAAQEAYTKLTWSIAVVVPVAEVPA